MYIILTNVLYHYFFKDVCKQKNVSLALSILLLTGLTNFINAKSNLEKIALGVAVATIAGGGKYAEQMNEEYSKADKDPDLKMRCTKALVTSAAIIGIDIVSGDNTNTGRNIAKVGCVLAASLAATQLVADVVRPIPLIGGILTDPVDENGKEQKDFGALSRFALAHIALRKIVLPYFPGKSERKDIYASL